MTEAHRNRTHAVTVGDVTIGGGAPVVVQTMTNTATADVQATAGQALELWRAGAELIRVTVNTDEAARAVPELRRRLDDAGCTAPLIGDFHYNGDRLLREHPDCAAVLAKYRINPGNVGRGGRGDDRFDDICRIARDHGAAVRIGVNGGSVDPELLDAKRRENAERDLGLDAHQILDACMLISALDSTERAVAAGLGEDRIVISCKVSDPPRLIALHRELARRTRQPLHLGLTEAGIGLKGLVWSASAMAVLLEEGIGDTIRVSLTPRPGGSRADEVRAAREILQGLGIRRFSPTVTACPGCGRTTSTAFQELAERVEHHIEERMPEWRDRYPGVEQLRIAVMGCIVNGPGESRSADIGISLPGTGESPKCPVYTDGQRTATLDGDPDQITGAFLQMIDTYVAKRFAPQFPTREGNRTNDDAQGGSTSRSSNC